MLRWVPLLSAGLALPACIIEGDGTLTCTFGGCLGSGASLTLVDEVGNQVAARGEYRVGFSSGGEQTLPFDCTLPASEPGAACSEGVIAISSAYQPSAIVELRYELEPGTFSAWERVQLQFTSHTEPDFNGPGCDCTWYEATDRSTLVPEAARRPLP